MCLPVWRAQQLSSSFSWSRDSARIRTSSGALGQSSVNVDQTRPRCCNADQAWSIWGKSSPTLARIGSNSAKFGQCWSNLGFTLVCIGQTSAQICPKYAAILASIGQHLNRSDRRWPNFATRWPTPDRLSTKSIGRDPDTWPTHWSNIGSTLDSRTNIFRRSGRSEHRARRPSVVDVGGGDIWTELGAADTV